jgi:hypothetical protein
LAPESCYAKTAALTFHSHTTTKFGMRIASSTHKEANLRRVYARDLIALGRLDPLIVDKQTSRLRILDTIRRSKLNRQTRHIASDDSKKSRRSRVSRKGKRSRRTEEGAVHLEKTKEGKCPRRYICLVSPPT